MVLGIVAVASAPLAPTLTLVSILTGVVGLVLGLVALRGATKRPATHGGRGQAIAGVVLSAVALVGPVLVLTLVAVRNTMA